MQQPADTSQAFVVTVTQTPAKETTIQEVILGSLAIAGVLLLAALGLGVLFAVVRLGWLRRHPPELDHLPRVSPIGKDSETTSP